MGVISTNKAALPVFVNQDVFFPADYLIESPESTDVDEDDVEDVDVRNIVATYGTPKRSSKFGRVRLPRVKHFASSLLPQAANSKSAKQRYGARKLRRYENAHLLWASVDAEDICEDLSDTLPETVSAFTQLFLESGKMKTWNDFVHKPEEEQEKILKDSPKEQKLVATSSSGKNDKRTFHPAYYSSQQRYRRMDGNLKILFSHKRAPLEKLEELELELTNFFNASSDGVWIGASTTGYDRLLTHAVSQYLGLRSRSFDGDSPEHRLTQVENPDGCFVEPAERLACFLRRKFS